MTQVNTKHSHSINLNGKLLLLDKPKVMGIVNLTPDSFYDGGTLKSDLDLLKRVESMLTEGAALIDIGGQSSKPTAESIRSEDELKRVIPSIELLMKHFPEIAISIDSYRSKVVSQAIEAGAAMVNDISAGSLDVTMFETLAKYKKPYVLMHMQGNPATMQTNPHYAHCVNEVYYWFTEKINALKQLGLCDIILDFGFGFGKTQAHNYELLSAMPHFTFLDLPILAGISRKSMVYKALNIEPNDALNGTSALHMVALQNGAKLLRVHDVKEAQQVIRLYELLSEHSYKPQELNTQF